MPTDETPQEIEVTSDVPSDEKPEIAEPEERSYNQNWQIKRMLKKFSQYRKEITEVQHKVSTEYNKLSPRMKKAIDDLFKSSDSIDKIDTNIDRVAKQYGVSKSKIIDYLDKETFAIV